MKLSRASTIQAVKIVGSLGLLVAIIAHVGPQDIARTLLSVRPAYLAVPMGLILGDQALRIVAWRTLLRAKGHHVSLRNVAQGFVAGTFFGALVPSTLGTDAARAVGISRSTGVPLREAASSVLVLSLFGLFAMCVAAVVSGTLLLILGRALAVTNVAVLFALGFITVLLILVEGRLPAAALGVLARFRLTRGLAERLEVWYAALHAYAQRDALWAVAGITLLNQLIGILWNYAAGVALGLSVPLLYFVLLIPIIMIGKLVPLTIMGFGVEQGYFGYLFGQLGVPAAEAVALSLLVASLSLVYNVLCGVAYTGASLGRLFRDAGRTGVTGVGPPSPTRSLSSAKSGE